MMPRLRGKSADDVVPTSVTVPRSEWDALHERLEELHDALVIEEFKRDEAAGNETFVPAVVANKIIDGESPLRAWRNHRGFTQLTLSTAAGVSRALIADIETGRKQGSFKTILALAEALKVHPVDLFYGDASDVSEERSWTRSSTLRR